ncbi:ferrochelatase hem15 [Spiromyces aspiralis]|uniref:Ferrochelatase hem15 n=1 Tax=Spiromyces aspiralis TaxID=68401 RepID=A0ACC1HU38_9FUNG|nr:ferrochelatase hem15 [Spiromyces aspiralis]
MYSAIWQALADNIEQTVQKVVPEHRDTTPILFSAHSLPLQVVDRGDPYVAEIGSTSLLVMDELRRRGVKNPYRVIWQSAVGPLRWLGPQTEDVVKMYGNKGHKSLILVPVAFTSDHIETLFELDIEYAELAKEHGVEQYLRVPSLNDNPTFIRGLAEIVKSHIDGGMKADNQQLFERCPGCNFEQCSVTKEFFRNPPSPSSS